MSTTIQPLRSNNGFSKIEDLSYNALTMLAAQENSGLTSVIQTVGIVQPIGAANYALITPESFYGPIDKRVPVQLPAKNFVLSVSMAGVTAKNSSGESGPLSGDANAGVQLIRDLADGANNGTVLSTPTGIAALNEPGGSVQAPTNALTGANTETFITVLSGGNFDGKGAILVKILSLPSGQ